MKKLLFLLLISIASYGQAEFPEGIQLGGNTEDNSATWVTVQSDNGNLNKILKTSFLPANFSNVVYVNSTSPTTATIFDLNNPPTVNDDGLKNSTSNLYIGNDGTTWTYKTSPAGYNTYVPPPTSNFYLKGPPTLIDAGNSKTVDITRPGSLTLSGETASTIASFDATKTIKSLSTATYPSLTELSYVKGLTSNAQTQFIGKANDNNVVHLSGNETRTDGSLTFKTITNANARIEVLPISQTITAYNTSNVISWRLRNGGASQGSGELGTVTSFFYWREAGGNQLGASTQLTVPNATVAGSALNKGQFDAVLLTSVSVSLDFVSTAAGTSSDLTIPYTGAVAGDMVILGAPTASVVANASYTAFVTTADLVTVRLNNYSIGSVNPAAGNFKVKILR